MKEFQKKLQNKKCMDASKAQCAPETTNPALLAREDFTQIKSAYSGRSRESLAGSAAVCSVRIWLQTDTILMRVLTLYGCLSAGLSLTPSRPNK